MTGSPRDMAPEVALDRPYNEKIDIYSFSILCWEMLALQLPYRMFACTDAFKQMYGKGLSRVQL